MRRFGGNPDGAHRGDYPDALIGAQRHDAFGGEDQLVFGMEMQRDSVPVRKIRGDAGDLAKGMAALVKKDAVALFRHLLSQ